MPSRAGPPRPMVLLIEDEPSLRRSMQLLLRGHGFDVRSYATRGAVLADPAAWGAAGLISDYRLPDGDGVDLLGRLRALGFAGGAILITAFGSKDLRERAALAGFHRVFDKPLADRTLTVALNQVLA